jgi:hypothetical protein
MLILNKNNYHSQFYICLPGGVVKARGLIFLNSSLSFPSATWERVAHKDFSPKAATNPAWYAELNLALYGARQVG